MVLCAAESQLSAIGSSAEAEASLLDPAEASVLGSAEAKASALRTVPAARPRPIRVGLLGLGHVGQAVVRLAHRIDAASSHPRFRIAGALVRDVARPRACHPCVRVTNNPSVFLRGRYDVVIESLGGLEPARSIVERLLGVGIPVVTANKTLIATAGPDLRAIAAVRGTSLRYEASAMAGVPFLGALAARPLVSAIDRFIAILNGTSNFILSTLETGGSFADALTLAERLGLTEPNPSRDLDGDDAADKLELLTALVGWGRADRHALEVTGVRHVTGDDLRAARRCGGSLKPVAVAIRAAGGIEAFVGPAWVSSTNPLATLGGTLNGIALHGRYVSDLCFSGPGAGPDVTAATLLDDAIEAFHGTSVPTGIASADCGSRRTVASVSAPVTPWFIRVEFPGHVPTAPVAADLISRAGVTVEHMSAAAGQACYALVAPADRARIDAALQTLRQHHRLQSVAYRRVE